MNSYFDQIELEMIALESAIGAYEVDNGITEEYLNDYSTVNGSYATEGAFADDDFGFGLFNDMAPATEEADGKSGGGLAKGIKNILSAVGRFFAKIGEGIKSFFQSFKSKKAQVKDANVSPAAEQAASNLRGAIKSAVSIIGNVTKVDTDFMTNICNDIKTAINSTNVSRTNKSGDYEVFGQNDRKRDEEFAKVGAKFVELSGGSDHAEDADERIRRANEILDKVEKTKKDLDAALTKLEDVFAAEVKKAQLNAENYSDRRTQKRGETSYQHKERLAAEDEENQKKLDAYNAEAKRRSSLGVKEAGSYQSLGTQNIENQIKKAIFVDLPINDIDKLCDQVSTACGGLEGFCKTVADKNLDDNGSENSKRAYKLCRILSRASTVYTKISEAIQELTSGTIFNKNGYKYGEVNTRKKTDATKDEQDYINE